MIRETLVLSIAMAVAAGLVVGCFAVIEDWRPACADGWNRVIGHSSDAQVPAVRQQGTRFAVFPPSGTCPRPPQRMEPLLPR